MDTVLPLKISLGTSSGLQFRTDVVTYGNGKEYRNSRWAFQKGMFDVSYVVKNRADAIEVYNFFIAAKGRFNTFRVYDSLDNTSNSDGTTTPTNTDQLIGTGDGSTVAYQLIKNYSNGVTSHNKNITKPVSGSVIVSVDDVNTTNFTVNTSTGIITLGFVPTLGQEIKAGFRYHLEMRFDQDDLDDIEYIFLRQDSSRDNFTFPSLLLKEVF